MLKISLENQKGGSGIGDTCLMYRNAPTPRKAKGIMATIRAEMFAADPACFYCRCLTVLPINDERYGNTATVDHKTPKSRGGHKTSRRNLALCCMDCNHHKGDLTDEEYRLVLSQRRLS